MLTSFAFLVAMSVPTGPSAEDVVTYVNGSKTENVVFDGAPFKAGRSWIEGGGVGRTLYVTDEIGPGDFEILARLIIDKRAGTAASFMIGDSHFGLDGVGNTLFLNGKLFGGKVTLLGSADGFFESGKAFELKAMREGSTLRFLIDGRLAYEQHVGAGRLGRFGLRPHRATLRVLSLSASGAIGPPEARGPAEVRALQPAINQAIDRGVERLLATQHRDGSWSTDADKFFGGMTALATYTLLKCGMNSSHPSIRSAMAYLEQVEPHETYTVAFTLLALEATHDPEHLEWMERLTEALLDWQEDGAWGYPYTYPGGWGPDIDRSDLSNVQIAALGLFASQRSGIAVPKRVWKELIEATLEYLGEESRVDLPTNKGRTGKNRIAGFRYKTTGGKAYGSMTASGIATLAICEHALGKSLGLGLGRKIQNAQTQALGWLEHHFTVTANPGTNKWLSYYLYGLERVGALLDIQLIGEHLWYLEGAESLLRNQLPNGEWGGSAPEAATCFSLLFLKRATAPSSGRSGKPKNFYASEGADAEVWFRASGDNPLTVWITGFGGGESKARIDSVEYLVDGKVVVELSGNTDRDWENEKYSARLPFATSGKHRIGVRVHVLPPLQDGTEADEPRELLAEGFDVEVNRVWSSAMDAAARLRQNNLLFGAEKTVRASSAHAVAWAASLAIDGLESTAWACGASDPAPTLEITLDKRIKADTLVIGTLRSSIERAADFDRIQTATVTINGDQRFPVRFESDSLLATKLVFPKPLRVSTIQIEITQRTGGARFRGLCGFSEVALLYTR
jgi:hypothetical protein